MTATSPEEALNESVPRAATPIPRWVKLLTARCRYCGALCKVYGNGQLASANARHFSFNCSARPWWTLGRKHKAKR